MTYEQLKMFLAVVRQGSFRGAAKAVFKTQSTVSTSVKALEDELGFSLFSRDGYRPVLTSEGQVFCRRAEIAIEHLDQLSDLGRTLAAGVESKFTIVLSPMCPVFRLLTALKPAIESFPHTVFQVRTKALGGVLEHLDDGDADLALTNQRRYDTRFEARVLKEATTALPVAAAGYFEIDPGDVIGHDEARRHMQIIIQDPSKRSPKTSIGVVPGGRVWLVDDIEVKKALIVAGLGWGILPKHIIDDQLADGRVVPIRVLGIMDVATVPVVMYRRADRAVGPVGQRLWQTLV